MAIQFTTTREAAALNGVKVLVYGRAGVGKTTLCATAPTPIILSAEAGLLSLRDFDIPVINIKTVQDLTMAHNWAQSSAEAKPFETICIDSISEIAEVVLSNAKIQVKDPRQAYGELLDKMLMTIREFRDLKGKNVYMTAKEEMYKDEGTGAILAGPGMPGKKLGPALPYMFDEVFCLNMGKTPEGESFRYLQTQPDFKYDAKDRSGALEVYETPSLTAIFNKIINPTKPRSL